MTIQAIHNYFYPRSPCGERPSNKNLTQVHRNFYPRSPCGERPQLKPPIKSHRQISIHALLAESDIISQRVSVRVDKFLSTLSLRRATCVEPFYTTERLYFYPRSPCGERPWVRGSRSTYVEFLSTLSLRRATSWFFVVLKGREFLSTLSLRRATRERTSIKPVFCISIHALLAESDPSGSVRGCFFCVFLSTLSLRRATISVNKVPYQRQIFLSTLSLRRATAKVHKTVGHFCAYETNFMGIASSC